MFISPPRMGPPAKPVDGMFVPMMDGTGESDLRGWMARIVVFFCSFFSFFRKPYGQRQAKLNPFGIHMASNP